jgi:hypothetical protein
MQKNEMAVCVPEKVEEDAEGKAVVLETELKPSNLFLGEPIPLSLRSLHLRGGKLGNCWRHVQTPKDKQAGEVR